VAPSWSVRYAHPVQRESKGAELLDGPLDDPAALRGNLRDLKRTNRWLGGARLSARGVHALLDGRVDVSILDVGTGGADIPLALLDHARHRGQRLSVTAVDSRREIIDAAHVVSPVLRVDPSIRLEVADGRALPYASDSFDICHASLVIHHLEPSEATMFLHELARVAVLGIVVNDLVRSRLTLAGAWLTSRLFTMNRYTRHDAPLSARRAYSRAELAGLLDSAGLRIVGEFVGLAGHRLAISAVRA
jgi:2-polyprenyl-3-methyl-5-hydroxy-6-metoxy-1,4-benzoquinol methylase